MIDYREMVVLVTGGASGIGLALAREFQGRGARLIIVDVNDETLQSACRLLAGGCVAIHCDLSQPDQQKALIEKAFAVHGRLDIVCSNAGIGHNKRVLKDPLGDQTARLFEINFFAGLRLAQAFHAVVLREGTQGRFLFTASENSLSIPAAVRKSGLGLYAATKHALLIAAEWIRDEIADGSMKVHVLLPGAVFTPLLAKVMPDPSKAPAELNLIMPERCAQIALKGMDLELFYIPTQAHLVDDMQPRVRAVKEAALKLGL